jgi:hypothetical protein
MTDNRINMSALMASIDADLGLSDCDMHRGRPYQGQDHTFTGQRGLYEVYNISFRDLRDAFIRGAFLSAYNQSATLYHEASLGEEGLISTNDLYTLDFNEIDPMEWFQNMACEIEKMQGTYPNIPGFPKESH